MKLSFLIVIAFALGLLLAACGSATPDAPTQPAASSTSGAGSRTPAENQPANDLTRTDSQGAVEASVTPLNLDNPEETLNFDVVLDNHSTDLSMDLALMATMTTDTGQSVQASVWDAPRGGHHVEGTLSFPASVEGQSILEGAKTLTLTIKDLDAPERSFAWDLTE